jgi:hypothetical protein
VNRDQIYEALRVKVPELKRRETTARVMSESGIDLLLDGLIEIQHEEAFLLLEGEEVGYGL